MLSIVIPTYNRAELLDYLLASITNDFLVWPSDLELVVIDNASTDQTSAVVSKFTGRNASIKYFVNEKNIGMDGNLSACFDKASGKYFWQIGDDEIMYSGTVQFVLELCRTKEFGLLHLASQGFSHGQQAEISVRKRPEGVVAETLDSNKLFRMANVFLTFISANVINRKAVLTRFSDFDAKAEFNTNLPQLAWTYSALKACDTHYYIRTPMFGALGGNTSGYKLVEVFGVNLIKITKKYLDGLIPNAERIMSNAVITMLLPSEFMAQFGKSLNKSKFEDENTREAVIKCFGGRFYFHLFITPLLSSSDKGRKISFFFLRVFNRFNREFGYIFL